MGALHSYEVSRIFPCLQVEFNNIALLCFVIPAVEMVHNLTFSGNEECTFDHRKEQGFVLHVPKEAVSSNDCTVEMKSQVVSQSTPEFIFPEGSKLVSSMYHVSASRKLSKALSLEVQHCAIIKDGSQNTQVEVSIADSATGPPYHFKPCASGSVHVFESYVEVKLVHSSFFGFFLGAMAIEKTDSIRYCGLVCCLKSSELTRTWGVPHCSH